MKVQTSALTFLLAASQSNNVSAFGITGGSQSSPRSTFVSSPLRMQSVRQISTGQLNQRSNMSMLADGSGGIEELKQLAKEGDKLVQTARKSPKLFQVGGIAAVPAAAFLGAALVPGSVLAAGAVGAVGASAGFIGKNRLDAATEAAAKPAIAQAIIDLGVDSADVAGVIQDIKSQYHVPEEDFAEMCMEVYKRYIIGMVKTPITKTSEMKELSNLRKALSMENLAVGEAHSSAAMEFYRQTSLFTPLEDLEDPDHPDRMSIDKFLFLSERTFRQGGETEEAFKYEMSRVAKAFNIKLNEALERVAEVAEPFYQKALDNTRAKLDSDAVSSDMLLRARNSLGIDDITAHDMHMSAYSEEVKALLVGADDPSTAKFVDGARERVSFYSQTYIYIYIVIVVYLY